MRKYILVCLIVLFLLPQRSSAFSDIEQNQLEVLQAQINLLLEEVAKLTQALSSTKSIVFIREPLSREENISILKAGTDWFKAAQEESGHFAYEYLPYEDRYLEGDNIVRQAGGLYALGEIAVSDKDEQFALKDTIENSISFFENQSSTGSVDGISFRCISNSSINSTCQLGATALALVGVIDLVERYPQLREKYDSLIIDYGNYIVAMKKEGTGFRGNYNEGSPLTERENSFSNGEGLLALVRYYKYSPSDEVKQIIDDTFAYFESDAVEFDFPLYLWVMAALKDMHELWPNERYVAYTKDYSEWRLNGFRYRKSSTHNMCAYIEGVISGYSVLEDSLTALEKERYLNEINFWLDKSKTLQLKDSDTHRIINNENGVRFGEIINGSLAFGGFLTDHNTLTQRIDFTQHCLNSYLQKLVDIDGDQL